MPRKKKTGKYKLKTHKATAKRFRMTATGKIVRTKGGKSHLRRRSAKRVKRQWDKSLVVGEKAMQRRIRRLAPYLGKYKANPPA
ncbi:MAG: 50S ribosomal protein L35 [Chloroflexi bacterium]|nr:50S ribosomal protein L35 [Chloroflexota bacterium]